MTELTHASKLAYLTRQTVCLSSLRRGTKYTAACGPLRATCARAFASVVPQVPNMFVQTYPLTREVKSFAVLHHALFVHCAIKIISARHWTMAVRRTGGSSIGPKLGICVSMPAERRSTLHPITAHGSAPHRREGQNLI